MVLADFLTETRRRWLKIQDDAGDLSGMSQPTVSIVCKQVALALVSQRTQWIKMPRTDVEQNNVIAGFYSLCGFRQVIGAIDCTHIRIPKVSGNVGQYYINRKGYSSINVQAFKLFKGNKNRKTPRNRISPALVRSPSYSGTVDARAEIDVQNFCACRASLPPLHINETYENTSYDSYNSYNSRIDSLESYGTNESNRSDSAYDSARSSPTHARVCYATVTYFNVNDSEDSSSIRTEYTLLDDADFDKDEEDEDERTQNMINESIELVSTL